MVPKMWQSYLNFLFFFELVPKVLKQLKFEIQLKFFKTLMFIQRTTLETFIRFFKKFGIVTHSGFWQTLPLAVSV